MTPLLARAPCVYFRAQPETLKQIKEEQERRKERSKSDTAVLARWDLMLEAENTFSDALVEVPDTRKLNEEDKAAIVKLSSFPAEACKDDDELEMALHIAEALEDNGKLEKLLCFLEKLNRKKKGEALVPSGASSSGVKNREGGKAGSAVPSKGAAGAVKRPAEAGGKGGKGKRAKK